MKRYLLFIVFIFLMPLFVIGQKDSVELSYIPKISGLLKTKWEYSFEDNTNRFVIRNARLSASGKLNPYINYRLQAEYSNQGQFSFLDAYVQIAPWKNFKLWVGQLPIHFSDDYVVSPSQSMFANRSFLAKFVNPGTRDIGARVDYLFSKKLPFALQAGIFNGMGINNPEWQDSPFLLGRLVYGTMSGFRGSIKYFGGKLNDGGKVANYGFDLRYAQGNYKIEAEYVIRDSIDADICMSATYLQGAYNFTLNTKLLKYIEPVLRGDAMGYDIFNAGFDVSRLTLGLNLGLDVEYMDAEIRFNYEHFFMRHGMQAMKEHAYYHKYFEKQDKGMFNKFTIEFLIKF